MRAMVDVRCALPAAPVAVLAGLVAATSGLEGSAPWMPVVAGPAALVTVFALAYRVMASWSERARRIAGYLAVVALALVVGAVLAMVALVASMCGWSSGPCFDDTLLL